MRGSFSTKVDFSKLAAGVALASSLTAAPAQAFSLYIDPEFGSTENTGSTAILNFNFVQQDADVLLELGITNTTNGSVGLGATQSGLVGVGFDLPTLINSYTYNSLYSNFTRSYGDSSLTTQTLINTATVEPYGTFDVGIRTQGGGAGTGTGGRTFAGGTNPESGLTPSKSASVSFLLSGNNLNAASVESAFLNGFKDKNLKAVGRFAQINADSVGDTVLGGIPDGKPQAVPEPASWVSLSFFAGAMAMLRRQKGSLSR